ncbi:hypothetical protein K491DRAFT_480494 [Lophiostoma macrostomum CBS 122681]|uniref:Uncharacterized protein n=1 Tax=Lophiostoma macrostomum CBS 122681 TaxID=1314788 RepID=A0A6A6TNY0_9PLEO|nr:hypothetical protein K491DRAFT_480494 [Lophiostoma macrostomum CBS 122681]
MKFYIFAPNAHRSQPKAFPRGLQREVVSLLTLIAVVSPSRSSYFARCMTDQAPRRWRLVPERGHGTNSAGAVVEDLSGVNIRRGLLLRQT